ncbi:hypothetical protein ACU4GR_01065 [Methylobacterium oryzae CBMB20]|jgi:hypothetical protein
MSDPEPDVIFRERLLRVVGEELRPFVEKATGAELDAIGRQHNRFRTGVPLKGLEAHGSRPASRLPEGLWKRR